MIKLGFANSVCCLCAYDYEIPCDFLRGMKCMLSPLLKSSLPSVGPTKVRF